MPPAPCFSPWGSQGSRCRPYMMICWRMTMTCPASSLGNSKILRRRSIQTNGCWMVYRLVRMTSSSISSHRRRGRKRRFISPGQLDRLMRIKDALKDELRKLFSSREFETAISQGTGDQTKVRFRFSSILSVLRRHLPVDFHRELLGGNQHRRIMELGGTRLQCGRRTLLRQQCNRINGMARGEAVRFQSRAISDEADAVLVLRPPRERPMT